MHKYIYMVIMSKYGISDKSQIKENPINKDQVICMLKPHANEPKKWVYVGDIIDIMENRKKLIPIDVKLKVRLLNEDMADAIGVSVERWTDIEDGAKKPSKREVYRLKTLFSCKERWVLNKIRDQFEKTPESQLMYAVLERAVLDISSASTSSIDTASALSFFNSDMPHVSACGVDVDWVKSQLKKYEIL